MMLKEVLFSSLFSLLSLSGANLHPTPKFILLSYAPWLLCLPKLEKKKLENEVGAQRSGGWNLLHPLTGTGVS